jgi:hypothetical protein
MRQRCASFLPGVFLLLSAWCGAAQQDAPAVVTVRVAVDKAAVIAFLPPALQDTEDKDAAAARDEVNWAIANIRTCLGKDFAYRVVFADRIVVRSHGHEQSFEVRTAPPLVGALLVAPGSNARIIFAGGGPEALTRLLRPAAGEYFERPCVS